MSSADAVSDRLLTRIGGLLRKAESTDNEHEAEAFLAAAQRLATRSSIDLAVARAHTRDRERPAELIQRMIPIGEPGRKGLRTYVQLFVAIAGANDVRCDVARTSTQVYAYGFAADITVCEALYSSLLVQMVRASDRYIKSGEYRSATMEKVVAERRRGRRVRRVVRVPVAGVTARLNFQMAFAERIGLRLAEAKQEVERAATTRDTHAADPISQEQAAGTALALRGKEIELADFYTRNSEARGTWRGPHTSTGYAPDARRAGDRAGRAARLGFAPELDSGRGQLIGGVGE
ncbi:DUF2786 domain-containing protein [Nocardia sp. NBC_00416]|uniref:DUF2786 domain-containing protein n=1 Tax=Nocardia sp. NBC_00416 TaxID=2975991 RepID=UPI002E209AB6